MLNFFYLLEPVEQKQTQGFTNWLLGGGGWFGKAEDEPLNEQQKVSIFSSNKNFAYFF